MRFLWLLILLALGCAAPAYSQAREGYIAADDGTKLFYKMEGAGPQILIVVHGGPGNSLESVRPDFQRLSKGRTVIYYDQRGNGRSDLVDSADRLAINHYIADLDAVRRHFGLQKITLLGNSWGGLLISAYAAAHPDRVERLILDASAPPFHAQLVQSTAEIDRRVDSRLEPAERSRLGQLYTSWPRSKDPVPACKAFYEAILIAYAFNPTLVPPHGGDMCSGPPEALRRQMPVNRAIWRSLGKFDLRPAVRKVTAPVLVIYGVDDVIPLRGSEDWAASYPDARLLVIQRAGHLAHLEQPDIFFGAVDKFLAGGWPDGAKKVQAEACCKE